MAKIKDIKSIMVLNSRGNPTIKTGVLLEDGTVATASIPSGASTGKYEAVELRDGGEDYNGLNVTKAIDNIINKITPALKGMDADRIQEIDKKMIELDGTDNKSNLGANAILSVSAAVARASAINHNMPLYKYIRSILASPINDYELPTPLFNMISGGQHADNGLDFQEYIVIPATQKPFDQKIEMGVKIYHSLRKSLAEKNMTTLASDEGGYAPDLANNTDALYLIKNAVDLSGYQFALDVFLGIDCAASNFTDTSNYKLIDRNTSYKPTELVEYYSNLATEFSLLYLEDPFAEDDIPSWKSLRQKISQNTLIVGDDLTVTNPYRLQMVLENDLITAIIIKPNQIGTVTEAIAVSEMARYKNLKVIVSHRSGETVDDFIADFAVGVGADYAKFGAPAHERTAKYNRLLEIYHETTLEKKGQ